VTQTPAHPDDLRDAVRARYAAAALTVLDTTTTTTASARGCGCCDSTTSSPSTVATAECCGSTSPSRTVVSTDLYAIDEVADLPSAAVLASLGCGNPTALAELKAGETVLDLGSGGGIDVLLSARRVGPTGFAFGLDMTDQMLALAERNAAEMQVANVRFLKGEIEHIPLPDATVDVVISNCVVNLSADKAQVIREAFRVLRPGGRFAVSDVVVQGHLPDDVRKNMELWAGCVAGALEETTYRQLLSAAGFTDIEVEVTRVYEPDNLPALPDARLISAFVRATRPAAA
jgi:arsenite methyltransferase